MTAIQTLQQLAQAGRIPYRELRFALSLIRADGAQGMTLSQAQWAERLVARLTAPAAPAAAVPGMPGVVALLARARASGLKFPKLWLRFADGSPLRITVAGEKSRTPGYLMLTDGESFGSNRYYGRISPQGALDIGRDGHQRTAELVALLSRLGDDPAGVAAEFGHLTGHCCFCSLALKDERSVAVGYGPICAEKFGVPWGERPATDSPKSARKARTRATAAA